jgi:hypothetical protein
MSDGSNNPMQADLSSPMEDLESSVPEQESEEVKKSRISRFNDVIQKVLMTPIIPGESRQYPIKYLLPSYNFFAASSLLDQNELVPLSEFGNLLLFN